MSRPRLVFITYFRLVPTGQIGIFKRCMRLITGLLDDFEIHLVNFGPLPETDGLFAEVAPRITIHPTPSEGLGDALAEIYTRLAPAAVILGETPLRGSMRMAHRVASAMGLWQVGLDNYYGPVSVAALPREWPRVDRWLLLGLTEDGAPTQRLGPFEVVPPLLRFPADFGAAAPPRDRVVVIGYDKQTVLTAGRLLGCLPPGLAVDFFIAPQWEEYRRRTAGARLAERPVQVFVLPPDGELHRSLGRARFVLGKAGFQQVVEGILLGAPIVCQAAGGGLESVILANYLQPYVRFVASEDDLGGVLMDLAFWLVAPPITRWSRVAAEIPDTIAFGARRLAALVAESGRAA
jgi:hypothetical protein